MTKVLLINLLPFSIVKITKIVALDKYVYRIINSAHGNGSKLEMISWEKFHYILFYGIIDTQTNSSS